MRTFKVHGSDKGQALSQLAEDLGVAKDQLRLIEEQNKEFVFEALSCPAAIEFDVSKDKMKARIRHIRMPIGENAPKLTTDFVLEQMKKEGITFGIKPEVITENLFKIFSSDEFDEKQLLNWLVAEGQEPSTAQGGRPQWILDIKLFDKGKPVFCKKGEVIAVAPMAVKGRKGMTVTGEELDFRVEEQFRLTVGKGIAIEKTEEETKYITEGAGQLFFDHGVRLRLEAKLIDKEDGLSAALVVGKQSFSKKPISGKDLRDTAEKEGVQFGLLSIKEIQAALDKNRKWPAEIIVARGKQPIDGKPGQVSYPYKKAKTDQEMDQEKVKEQIVFPGEIIAMINPPVPPEDGQTVFGEVLRGRAYNEMPIYPGKNVKKTREKVKLKGQEAEVERDFLRSEIYGRVKNEKDRISVENIIQVSSQATKATIDVFPQQKIAAEMVIRLLRDKDVLFGFDKTQIEKALDQIHQSKTRDSNLVVAQATKIRPGKNAKLRYYFRPDDLIEKGVLLKSKPKQLFAGPGDLLLEKFLPQEAEAGFNVYREPIEVPKKSRAIDVHIDCGKYVEEIQVGTEGDENNPPRIQYRAVTFGLLKWENKSIDLKPVLEVDDKEEFVKLQFANKTDFGTLITYDMIEKLAEEEGIRVELEKREIIKALHLPRPADGGLNQVVIAKAQPTVNGKDAKIEYYVEFNGESINELLEKDIKDDIKPKFCDCVRPKEILATKTLAGIGQDGMSVFGRKTLAERGKDEPWQIDRGIDRNEDGTKIFVSAEAPGFVMIVDRRLTVVDTIEIDFDKMTARMTIYPSKNPRFQPREDKIMEMISARGITAGIKKAEIKQALAELNEGLEPIELVIAEGQAPAVGREATHRFAIEIENSAGKLREDGSIDYKAGGVFQTVTQGQLLLTKKEPTRGEDGFNVFGENLEGLLGEDHHVDTGPGVRVSANGFEYFATTDGIVEFTGKRIQVIDGLLIPGDVDYSTGNIESASAQVMVRGAVLPGFKVISDADIVIRKAAEGCELISKSSIRCQGGIIGQDKGYVYAVNEIEALYINSGATVECEGDIKAENECLNSIIHTGGFLIADRSPGTISGGEIWAFGGVQARNLGSPGSERPTKIYLGVNFLEKQAADKEIKDLGLDVKEQELLEEVKSRDAQLSEIYDQIPELTKKDPSEASRLQEDYRELYLQRKDLADKLEDLQRQKNEIAARVKINEEWKVTVRELIHPGTTFVFGDVEWVLKEPLKGVQITWNKTSNNFNTHRI